MGETAADNQTRVYVRRWTGTAWTGVGGGGDGLVDTAPTANAVSLALGPGGPFLAWGRGAGSASSIFVRAWDGGSWVEIGTGSASGTGISGSPAHDFIPSIALDRATIPTAAWVDALSTEASGQTFVRTFDSRPLPDLTVTTITAPATERQGQTISVSSTVRNAGPAAAGPFVIRFFLSADATPDASDVLLGTRSLAGLGAGVSSPAALSVTVPATVAAGTYRIVAVADAAGQQAELDETNDVALSPPLTVSR